jgi:hypothetical protein
MWSSAPSREKHENESRQKQRQEKLREKRGAGRYCIRFKRWAKKVNLRAFM